MSFSNAAAQGSDSFGGRLSGRRALEEEYFLDYEFSWAYQQDGRSSPLDYRAQYSLLSIAGVHLVAEEIDQKHQRRRARVELLNEQLVIHTLS